MRLIFMGTPQFAAGALEAILEAGHEVVCVVTQPDKPKGRGKVLQCSPVKECAVKHGIPVFQPVKIREPQAVAELAGWDAELFVVAAFGQILSAEILDMPKYGCVNIHASLLPKYRGAAPIQWAIIDGETQSGVTIMQMNEGLDTGDMLTKAVVPILDTDTGDSLHDKLMAAGAELIVKTLPQIEAGTLIPQKQDDAASCYAKRLQKSQGRLDFTKEAVVLERLIRGLNSWPGSYTQFRNKNLKIWEASVKEEMQKKAAPGTIVNVTKDEIWVQTGNGILAVTALQPEGKRRMETKEFLLGYPIKTGERFGE